MRNVRTLSLIVMTFVLVACASTPVTRVNVQSYEVKKQGMAPNAAVTQLLGVLVDRGFDVKMTNAESGIVTTEYKKFATIGNNPPFDFYMQIRSRVRAANDGVTVSLTPTIREQNRGNPAAFTEHELEYFEGDPENVAEIASMQVASGWRVRARTLFMNVVQETAAALGVSAETVVENAERTGADAGDYEN